MSPAVEPPLIFRAHPHLRRRAYNCFFFIGLITYLDVFTTLPTCPPDSATIPTTSPLRGRIPAPPRTSPTAVAQAQSAYPMDTAWTWHNHSLCREVAVQAIPGQQDVPPSAVSSCIARRVSTRIDI